MGILDALYRKATDPILSSPPVFAAGRQVTTDNPSEILAGLDLGQAQDPTALAIVERTEIPDPKHKDKTLGMYACRELRRWPLGTSYPAIIENLKETFSKEPFAGCRLAADYTGVGRPIVDMIRAAKINVNLVPVTLTAGLQVTDGPRGAKNVPKRTLCGTLQVLLSSKRLTIAKDLPEARFLMKELTTFTAKISLAGAESFEAWREKDHDDLVLALAFALWLGEGNRVKKFNWL